MGENGMSWYPEALMKYAVFEGRARRREYWYFILFTSIIGIILNAADMATGTIYNREDIGLFGGIFGLAVFIPSITVTVRRLHDTDRSGWWSLIAFIPSIGLIILRTDRSDWWSLIAFIPLLIGSIILLVFTVQEGTQGENRYGGDPKRIELGNELKVELGNEPNSVNSDSDSRNDQFLR
jgi:uncharacterized membrane protein YhaH (DUF805 family)